MKTVFCIWGRACLLENICTTSCNIKMPCMLAVQFIYVPWNIPRISDYFLNRFYSIGLCNIQEMYLAWWEVEIWFLKFNFTRRSTVGRTPLNEWSARRRDLYLTTHDTHNRQISMPPVGFEPKISAGERPCRSPAEILCSNPTRGMDICLLWVSCVVR